MSSESERGFRRDIASLPDIFRFIEERLAALGVDDDERIWADLIVEELFTNMVKYSPSESQKVRIGLDSEGDKLVIRLTDFDVEPFDLTRLPEVDITRLAEEKRPGGRGLHLVRRGSDDISYEYENRCNIITVIRRLEC